jgi:hypothetical protein
MSKPARNGRIMDAVPTQGRNFAWLGFAIIDSGPARPRKGGGPRQVSLTGGPNSGWGDDTRHRQPAAASKEISWTRTSKR